MSLIVLGSLLLISSAAYFTYARISEAQLGRLEKKALPEASGGSSEVSWEEWSSKEAEKAGILPITYGKPEGTTTPSPDSAGPSTQEQLEEKEQEPVPVEVLVPLGPPLSGVRLPLGTSITPAYLPDISLEPSPLTLPVVRIGEGGIKPKLLPRSLPVIIGEFLPAKRIVIPSIKVDSGVVHLDVVWEEGVLVWETAKNAVGHHRGTPNPGQRGNSVMSGHKSSPIRGEGAVFHDLYKVKPGDEVWIYTEAYRFLYRVVELKIVKPEEVDVFASTPAPTLTLITCEPDLVYSHRLIVTAKLVGASPIEATQ